MYSNMNASCVSYMRIGVMQPYFFPYIGYWQLIGAVDKFVIFDDVNHIKRGWINRNRILYRNQVRYFNVCLEGASQNKLINEISVDQEHNKTNYRIIEEAYSKAPYFNEVYPVFEKILKQEEKNLARYNGNLIKTLVDYLDIDTELLYSSDIKKDNALRGQDKIISICKTLGGDQYINAIGGKKLYDTELFARNELQLFFIKSANIEYKQFNNCFEPDLSIIDVLMFNSREKVLEYLNQYFLVE